MVIPKGSGKDPQQASSSYRSISLLPTPTKALETLIVSRLENEIGISAGVEQHGFTQYRSTITAFDAVLKGSENCTARHVIGVFLDITRAFDNISRESILRGIATLGASVTSIEMVKSYLIVP